MPVGGANSAGTAESWNAAHPGQDGSPLLARLSAARRHPTSGHDDAIEAWTLGDGSVVGSSSLERALAACGCRTSRSLP